MDEEGAMPARKTTGGAWLYSVLGGAGVEAAVPPAGEGVTAPPLGAAASPALPDRAQLAEMVARLRACGAAYAAEVRALTAGVERYVQAHLLAEESELGRLWQRVEHAEGERAELARQLEEARAARAQAVALLEQVAAALAQGPVARGAAGLGETPEAAPAAG